MSAILADSAAWTGRREPRRWRWPDLPELPRDELVPREAAPGLYGALDEMCRVGGLAPVALFLSRVPVPAAAGADLRGWRVVLWPSWRTLPASQLVAVLAHELGHLAHRHRHDTMPRRMAVRCGALLGALASPWWAPWALPLFLAVGAINEVAMRRFIERTEREADQWAMRFASPAALAAMEPPPQRWQDRLLFALYARPTSRPWLTGGAP